MNWILWNELLLSKMKWWNSKNEFVYRKYKSLCLCTWSFLPFEFELLSEFVCLCLGRFVAILISSGYTFTLGFICCCSCVQLIVVAMVIEAICWHHHAWFLLLHLVWVWDIVLSTGSALIGSHSVVSYFVASSLSKVTVACWWQNALSFKVCWLMKHLATTRR